MHSLFISFGNIYFDLTFAVNFHRQFTYFDVSVLWHTVPDMYMVHVLVFDGDRGTWDPFLLVHSASFVVSLLICTYLIFIFMLLLVYTVTLTHYCSNLFYMSEQHVLV